MSKHELKTWPQYFQAVKDGSKTFEVRQNDRTYQVGDELTLLEWDPEKRDYTGSGLGRVVTYVLDMPAYCKEGYVILGLGPVPTWLREQAEEIARLQEHIEGMETTMFELEGERDNASRQIESLRAELDKYRSESVRYAREHEYAVRERDEARQAAQKAGDYAEQRNEWMGRAQKAEQANTALLEKLRDIRDNPGYGIAYKRWNRVEDLLAQYDTAQPTAHTVWTCGKCKNNFVGDDCPYCTAQGEDKPDEQN